MGSRAWKVNVFPKDFLDNQIFVNNFLLTAAAASILLGTLYPLFIDVLELGKVSVGAPYFESVFVPMMIPMIVIMGVAPLLKWKRGDFKTAIEKLKLAIT